VETAKARGAKVVVLDAAKLIRHAV
jgi:hypothetical protein